MSLGTKNRLNLIGTTCKAHLRERFSAQGALLEEFISEIEGTGKNADPNAWGKFTDAKRDNAMMLQRVGAAFEAWLNP